MAEPIKKNSLGEFISKTKSAAVCEAGVVRASHLMTMRAGNSDSDADEPQFPVLRVLLKHNSDCGHDC